MMTRFIATIMLCLCSNILWAKGFVVSIHPLYLIAQEVTKGIEKPELLLGNQSGHDIQLTPENRKALQDAELVIWVGKAHEAPLDKILSNKANAVSLLSSGVLATLPLRDLQGQNIPNSVDTHVWLEPNNAVRIAFFMAALRSKQHPESKDQYWANARDFSQKLLAETHKFGRYKVPAQYWTYHDAYQYLERSLNLQLAGVLTSDPHIPPTVSQIKYLNDHRPYPRMCLLAEGETSRNQYEKLQPIQFQSVEESLAGETQFISAWSDLAKKVHDCVQTSRN